MLADLWAEEDKLEERISGPADPAPEPTTVRRYIYPAWDWTHTEGAGGAAALNQIRCFRFQIFDTFENVVSITTWLTVFNSVTDWGVWAVYNDDGTELLCQFPPIQGTAAVAGAVTSGDLVDPVTLDAGGYWLAWSGPGLNGLDTAYNGPVVSWLVILNADEIRLGRSTTLMGGAVPPFSMPLQLGTIITEAGIGVPLVRINTAAP